MTWTLGISLLALVINTIALYINVGTLRRIEKVNTELELGLPQLG